MKLIEFSGKAGATSISGSELDANFTKLRPLHNDGNPRQYVVTETPHGWTLKIFPQWPVGDGLHVLGFQNGVLSWVPTTECP